MTTTTTGCTARTCGDAVPGRHVRPAAPGVGVGEAGKQKQGPTAPALVVIAALRGVVRQSVQGLPIDTRIECVDGGAQLSCLEELGQGVGQRFVWFKGRVGEAADGVRLGDEA